MEDSLMTVGTDDQMSQYIPGSLALENFRKQEKLDDLKCEVRELSRDIVRSGSVETERVSLNPDQTVTLPERSATLKRKTQIVNALRVELEQNTPQDGPTNNADAFCVYTHQLEKDVESIEQCIFNKTEEDKQMKHRLERLEKSKKALDSYNKGLEESQNNGLSELELMEPLINEDFNRIKGVFTRFLTLTSPSGALQEVLQVLDKTSNCTGEEQYIEITDDNFALISMLRKASLVVSHPRTPGKVRLLITNSS